MQCPPPSRKVEQVDLVLASTSARRRQLLSDAGYVFEVHLVDVDETQLDGEAPEIYVQRVASDKARDVGKPGIVSVGADTVVVTRGAVMGKPVNAAVAAEMLQALSAGTHQVMTGWACSVDELVVTAGVEITDVTFRTLSAGEIADYIATGEPMDRAGAYAIQGGAGPFVAAIDGSYTNVVGLPMEAVGRALTDLGIRPATA